MCMVMILEEEIMSILDLCWMLRLGLRPAPMSCANLLSCCCFISWRFPYMQKARRHCLLQQKELAWKPLWTLISSCYTGWSCLKESEWSLNCMHPDYLYSVIYFELIFYLMFMICVHLDNFTLWWNFSVSYLNNNLTLVYPNIKLLK